MTDPKCTHAHIDGLASMDLPEGHAPEVLCTLTDIGPYPCIGKARCRFFRAEANTNSPVEDLAAAFPVGTWPVRLKDAELLLAVVKAAGYLVVPAKPNNAMIEAAAASHAMITPGMAHDAIRAALDAVKEPTQ